MKAKVMTRTKLVSTENGEEILPFTPEEEAAADALEAEEEAKRPYDEARTELAQLSTQLPDYAEHLVTDPEWQAKAQRKAELRAFIAGQNQNEETDES